MNLFELGRLRDLRRVPAVALDTTHLGTWNVDLLSATDVLGDRIAHVHLSDYDGTQHCLPGAGRLPLGPFLQALSGRGFSGVITVELVPEALGAGDDDVVAKRLAQACDFCRQNVSARAAVRYVTGAKRRADWRIFLRRREYPGTRSHHEGVGVWHRKPIG